MNLTLYHELEELGYFVNDPSIDWEIVKDRCGSTEDVFVNIHRYITQEETEHDE